MPTRRARSSAHTVADTTDNNSGLFIPFEWEGSLHTLGVWLSTVPTTVRNADGGMQLFIQQGVFYNPSTGKVVGPSYQHVLDYRDDLIVAGTWAAPALTRPDLASTPKPLSSSAKEARSNVVAARALAAAMTPATAGAATTPPASSASPSAAAQPASPAAAGATTNATPTGVPKGSSNAGGDGDDSDESFSSATSTEAQRPLSKSAQSEYAVSGAGIAAKDAQLLSRILDLVTAPALR